MKKRYLLILLIALTMLIVSLIIKETSNNQINKELTLEELRSLPYLTYYTEEKINKSVNGIVIKHNPELTFEGYNLVGSNLIDMEGNIVHSWNLSIRASIILENGDIIIEPVNKKFIGENGDIIIESVNKTFIGKYDWDSNVIWEKDVFIHHEITLSPDNTILIPSREMHEYNGRKVDFDLIIELSQEGEELSRWSTYENLNHIRKFHEPLELDQLAHPYKGDEVGVYDYYHLNSIHVLPETPIGKNDKRFQAGNWLLSLRNVNLIVILDKETKDIVWSWGPGELAGQHCPQMLGNGNILVYDNGLYRRNYTRVIELDPIKKEIVWEYKANPPESFFSEREGYAQRLPNGNTLITDSKKGRVFEITKDGEIVWEWFFSGTIEEGRGSPIYRMVRYPKGKIDKLLELYEDS